MQRTDTFCMSSCLRCPTCGLIRTAGLWKIGSDEGGWDIEQSVQLARTLKDEGVDLIDCSSGGNVAKAEIPLGPGYQTRFAERIRHDANISTAAVGLITSAQQADHILRTAQADLVVIARQLLRDPYWPLRAAFELKAQVQWPNQYLRAKM
jgi:2,4-dienoyl-CoA reductase-like NADH-dependent reductase (Old Yellow Enzyme family)